METLELIAKHLPEGGKLIKRMRKDQALCNLDDIMYSVTIAGKSNTISRSQIESICRKAIALYESLLFIKDITYIRLNSSFLENTEKELKAINDAIDKKDYKIIR